MFVRATSGCPGELEIRLKAGARQKGVLTNYTMTRELPDAPRQKGILREQAKEALCPGVDYI